MLQHRKGSFWRFPQPDGCGTSPCPISGHKSGEVKAISFSMMTEGGSEGFGLGCSNWCPATEQGLEHLGVPRARSRVLCSPCPSEGTEGTRCSP